MLSGSLLYFGLAGLALPGLATFVSEFMVLVGTFSRYRVAAVIATVGIILAALYILILYQRTMTGPVRDATAGFPDLRRRELLIVAPLAALILIIGIVPKPLVDVIDDGMGISEEDQAQLFTQFFRGESAAVREQNGWGLGLSIVRMLVEAQSGTVSCTSQPGQGSTFTFTVPLAEEIGTS
jgi:formate hydrogenlyase subunit 3/multisubunit Na+/H+ antiporter MnhD subunit